MHKKILFLIPLFFIACSHKPKPGDFHSELQIHQQIKKDIQNVFLDNADDDLMNLEAEFPSSPYIKSDLLTLYLAHLQNEDYILAKFYLNQYEKRFASAKEIPWCEYQKIKIDYISYQNAYTNQQRILNLIKECKNYKLTYPNSIFLPEINTIYMKAVLTNKYLNDKIYKLYKKLGKENAAKLYKTEIPKNSKPPKIPWYKKIFYW